MNNFLTIQQAASLLGMSAKTLRRWEAKGILIPQRTPGNQRRYTQTQLDKLRLGKVDASTQQETISQKPQELIRKRYGQESAAPLHGSYPPHPDYWSREFVKSINTFRKMALMGGLVMLFVVISALAFATVKSAGISSDDFSKIISFAGIGDQKEKPKYKEIPRAVLGIGTQADSLVLDVNIPSEFVKSAQFLDTIKVAGIATLSGGIVTENSNIDAGTGELTASNVVYGLVAGTGIDIGPGQTPTVTNTGVLSLGGVTGAVSLTAGTGISISGLTISNSVTDTDTIADAFKNIKVGSDTITAGTDDTLIIAAGTGLSVSANTSSKTVTISPNGSTVGTAACVTTTNGIVTGSAACQSGIEQWDVANGSIYTGNSTLDLLIGGQTTASAKFAILNVDPNASGTPTASVSAGTAGGAYLTATGNLQTTAKQSLTLGGGDTGEIILSNFGAGIIHSNASGVLSSSAVDLASADVTGILPTANGGSWWNSSLGSLYPGNTTLDLLIGGTTTTSALFAITNVNDGTPIATLSASTNNNGLVLDAANSTIQSLRNNTLTIGGNTTGNIILTPLNGLGRVGINNTSPANALDVTGIIQTTGFKLTTGPASGYALISDGTGVGAWTNTTTGGSLGPWTLTGSALFPDFNYTNVLIGSETAADAIGKFTVSGTARQNSLVILNQAGTNANDYILAASASGVTKFVIDNAGRIGVNSSSPLSTLDVRPNLTNGGTISIASVSGATSFAGLLADNTGVGDLFTASKSGATKFTILNNGNLQFAGTTNFLSTLASAATAARTWTFPDATGTICLSSNNCTASQLWATSLGALYPGNSTMDLLIGGTTTTSALFAITNVNDGTPIATLSASTNNNGLVLDAANSTIQSLRNNTLTIGGDTSGLLVLKSSNATVFQNPGTNNIFVGEQAGNVNAAGNDNTALGYQALLLNTSGDFNTAIGSGALATNATNVNNTAVGYQALNKTTSGSNTALGFKALWTNDGGGGANTGVGASAVFSNTTGGANVGIGNSTLYYNETGSNNTAVGYFAGAGTSNNSYTGNSFFGTLAARSITTGSNNTALGFQAGYGAPGSGLYATTTGGNNTFIGYNASAFSATQRDNMTAIGAFAVVDQANSLVLGGLDSYAVNVGIGTATPSAVLDIQGGNRGGNAALIVNQTGASTNDIISASASGTTRFVLTNSGGLGLNTGANNSTLLSTLDVRPNLTNGGTISIASVSGATSFAGLLADNTGVGDLFTASKSGATKFTILNNGNLQFAGTTNFLSTLASAATAARTWTFPDATGTICIDTNNCGYGLGTNWWTTSADGKALTPINSTQDLLIGGITSSSSKFAVLNVDSGTPIASISAQNAAGQALSLSADGTIQSLRRGTLTLGGSTTGDIFLKPGNIQSIYLSSITGRVGLGTQTAPKGLLDISGDAGNNATLIVNNSTAIGDVLAASSSGTNRFVVTNAGRVGVNIPSPNHKLDVVSNNETGTLFSIISASGNLGGSSTSQYGILSAPTATATTTNLYASAAQVRTAASAITLENAYAYYATNAFLGSGAAITNNYGIFIADMTSGSSNYGLVIAGADTQALWVGSGADNTDAANGIAFGQSLDTNLYRSAANTLRTDSLFHINSGITGGNAALIVNQTGASTNDIFTASASGTTRFRVTNTGEIVLGDDTSSFFGTIDFEEALTDNRTYQLPNAGGVFCLQSDSNCGFTVGTNYWQQVSAGGAIAPIIDTLDLLVGGQTTASAKFAVLNVNSGTPTASVSAGTGTSGGAYLTAGGNLATTNLQSLTLGGSTTGDISFKPKNIQSLYLSSITGRVGVGTQTNPKGLLDISGSAGNNAALILNQTGTGVLDDIFTASRAGTTKFTIANTGSVYSTSSATTTDAFSISANSLTTGKGLNLLSTSSNFTSAKLLNVDHTATYTIANTISGNLANLNRSITPNVPTTVEYDAASTKTEASGAGPHTWIHTVGSGNNRILLVSVAAVTARSVSAITYNGASLTLVPGCSGSYNFYLYYLLNPSKGANTVSVTFSGAGVDGMMGAVSYNNVNQTSPFRGTSCNTSSGAGTTTDNLAVTSQNGDLGIDAIYLAGTDGSLTVGGSSTQRINQASTNVIAGHAERAATGSTVTMSWDILSNLGDNWDHLGVALRPAVSLSLSGALASLSSNCIGIGAGDCIDTANILSLTQNNATSSGALLNITSSGLGAMLNISGASGGKAAVIINQTSGQDLLVASASGITKFRVDNSGNLTVTSCTGCGAGDDYISITSNEDTLTTLQNEYDIFEDANYPGGTQTTPDETANNISFTDSSGRFTVTNAGTYLIIANYIAEHSAIAEATFTIKVNGSNVWTDTIMVHSSVDPVEITVSTIKNLSASDYVEFFADSNGTASLTMHTGTTGSLVKVGSGADYAEVYQSTDPSLRPGDVVSIDPGLAKGVLKSTVPYDSRLMGVVSTRPEEVVGAIPDTDNSLYPIALNGRVPVKVSTESGGISAGDLLTSSSVPGVAMKADPRLGSTIGTALEPYNDSGEGVITMFVDRTQRTDLRTAYADIDLNAQSLSIASGSASIDVFGNFNTIGDISGAQLSVAGGQFSVDSLGNLTTQNISAQDLDLSGDLNIDGGITTASLSAMAGNDLAIKLGDSIGANAFKVRNFAGTELLSLDSLGNLTLSSSGSALTVPNGYICVNDSGTCDVASPQLGVIYADSFETGQTADLAEKFATTDDTIEAGDIVVADLVNKEKIVKSTKSYQSDILGIISTDPGITLNSNNGDEISQPVALAGRVPVKITTENGAIKIGDMITSSSVAGVGMKATKPGIMVGRALKDFDSSDPGEVGKITVMVNTIWVDPRVQIAADGSVSNPFAQFSSEQASQLLGLINPPASSSAQPTNDPVSSGSSDSGAFDLASDPLFADLASRVGNTEAAAAVLGDRVGSAEATIENLTGSVLSLSDQLASQSAFIESILGASGSGTFGSPSGGFSSGEDLEIGSAIVSEDLNVLGRTTLTDLGITGNITAGLLSVNGLDSTLNNGTGGASINSVGDLNLQSNGLGGINILSGKILIDTDGNIKTEGEITAKKVKIDTASDAVSRSLGSDTILAGDTFVDIDTTAVTSKSRIFITPTTKTGGRVLIVKSKTSGVGFRIELETAYTQNIKFDWWIVDEE